MAHRDYKIRRVFKKGSETMESCSLAVPKEIAEKLSHDLRFSVELTSEGILYRPQPDGHDVHDLPDWAKDAAPE